jgi:hypothetical protein
LIKLNFNLRSNFNLKMENIFYQSEIEYLFAKRFDQILKLQYEEYKKQIVYLILDEANKKFNKKFNKNKILKKIK